MHEKGGDTNKAIIIFQDQPVRRVWVEEKERWYFAIVDVVQILTDSIDPAGYIKDMRRRDEEISKGWGQIATPLWMQTAGGRQQMNCADVEGVLRLIQSIPSPKAEPFKLWLARIGYERLQETIDPERAIARARENWKMRGRPESWIERRMQGQEIRNKLTDYWKDHEVKEGAEYAALTNVIHQEWSGISVQQHKEVKDLSVRTNLRDHMNEAELLFSALAEFSTTQIAKAEKARGYNKNEVAAHKGGAIAGTARQSLEQQTGKSVITDENFLAEDEESRKRKGLEN